MRVIVDENIVFSAILNTEGKIGDLLINSEKFFIFIAPDFLKSEIRHHYSRLVKISRMTLGEVQESESQVCKSIKFISPEQILSTHWTSAENLVKDIDPKDIQYVAYSKHFHCRLWSGDKVLAKGLAVKDFKNIITTDELFKLRQGLQK